MTRTSQEDFVPSPCIGLCQLDRATQLCMGCLRTGAEIAVWPDADSDLRTTILKRLRDRADSTAIRTARARWDEENR